MFITTTSATALVVGTDGSPAGDRQVREAAQAARARNAALHVVCSVPRQSRASERMLDEQLPADIKWLAGHHGQCESAMTEVRYLLSGSGVDVHVTASERRVKAAVRRAARRINGEIYAPARDRRAPWLPALPGRVKVAS